VVENEGLSLSEEINRLYRHDFLMREGEKASPEESHPSRDDARATKIIQETLEFEIRIRTLQVWLALEK
jgi:hypothetical protein